MKFTMIALYSQLNALHLKISQKYAHNRYTTQICKFIPTYPLENVLLRSSNVVLLLSTYLNF